MSSRREYKKRYKGPLGLKLPSLEERISILNKYNRTKCFRTLARMFGYPIQTIQRTIDDREKYLEQWAKQTAASPDNVPLYLVRIGQLLPIWIQRCNYCKIPVKEGFMRRMSNVLEDEIRNWKMISVKPLLEFFTVQFEVFKRTNPPGEPDKPSLDEESILEAIQRECAMKRLLEPLIVTKDESKSKSKSTEVQREETPELIEPPEEVIEIDSEDDSRSEADIKSQTFSEMSDISDDADGLQTYHDALKYLRRLENFALRKENLPLVGLVNQIENILRDAVSVEQSCDSSTARENCSRQTRTEEVQDVPPFAEVILREENGVRYVVTNAVGDEYELLDEGQEIGEFEDEEFEDIEEIL